MFLSLFVHTNIVIYVNTKFKSDMNFLDLVKERRSVCTFLQTSGLIRIKRYRFVSTKQHVANSKQHVAFLPTARC